MRNGIKTADCIQGRSFSFSDAQIIAQSVVDGDPKVINELYPGFPFSESIYTVIDRAKNTNSEKRGHEDLSRKSSMRKTKQVVKKSSSSDKLITNSVTEENDKHNVEQLKASHRYQLSDVVTLIPSNMDTVTGRRTYLGSHHLVCIQGPCKPKHRDFFFLVYLLFLFFRNQ